MIQVKNEVLSDEKILDLAIKAGAKDCVSNDKFHEILTEKEDFYKVKSEIEKQVKEFIYSGIEWRAHNYIKLNKAENEKITELLETLDDDDDIQNVFFNCKIGKV